LKSPAEKAFLSAMKCCWAHLEAAVTFYAIESVFVALLVVEQGLPQPVAQFNNRMIACNGISLFLEDALHVFFHSLWHRNKVNKTSLAVC